MSTLRLTLTLRLALTTAGVMLAGCGAVGPNYQRPALAVPASLGTPHAAASSSSSPAATVNLQAWWKSFQDPVLDKLLDEAVANNQDIVLAAGRVEEARATSSIANSNRYPSLDGNIGVSKSRTSMNGGKLPAGAQPIAKDYLLSVNASYEIDFWGKLSRADEAARARMLSLEANRGLVTNTLLSSVAQSYFSLRSYDAQLALALSTLQTRQENLRLQKKRFDAGSIGELDLQQSVSEAAGAEVIAAQARQAVAITESALAVLLGRTPAGITTPVIERGTSIDTLYAHLALPAELPSDLLNRRPDIIAAEQNLIAANADVGQAKASYFPSIKLASGYGRESRALEDLFNPASLLWNVGLSLAQPLFRAGAIGAVVSGAEARKKQALAQYVQTVQNAFRDVHDSLINLTGDEQIYDATKRRVAALEDTRRLADLRYKNGYSSYLELLNAQRDLQQAQASLIDTQRAHLSVVVGLYKAVGGGWDNAAATH